MSLSDTDPQMGSLLVPYIGEALKTPNQESPIRKFVPTKLVEPYVIISSTTIRAQASDWDVMYLKMLAVYCENNSQQYINRESGIISLDGLLYSQSGQPVVCSGCYKLQVIFL